MKIKKELQVNENEFFDYLVFVLLKEVRKSVDRHVKKEDLKAGYEFVRRVKDRKGNLIITRCRIEQLEAPHEYHLSMGNEDATQHIVHHVEALDDKRIRDTYEEYTNTKNKRIFWKTRNNSSKLKDDMERTLTAFEIAVIARRTNKKKID